MCKINAADAQYIAEVPGPERLKGLLKARGYTQSKLARERGHSSTAVNQCIHGDREYPEIRDSLSDVLDLPRFEIDRLIGGEHG